MRQKEIPPNKKNQLILDTYCIFVCIFSFLFINVYLARGTNKTGQTKKPKSLNNGLLMQTCQHISIIQQQQQNNAADKNRTLLLFTGPDSLPKHTRIVVRNKQKNGILKTERKDIVKIIYD